jgi:hypothetical protein
MKRGLQLGLLLALLAWCAPAHAAWGFGGTGNATSASAANLTASAFGVALTNPSIIACEVQFSTGQTVSNLTDTALNTYVDSGVGAIAFNSSNTFLQVYYALNTHTTASNAVKVTYSATTAFPSIECGELTGGATSSPIDVTQTIANQTNGPGANALVITAKLTTINGDLIFAAYGSQLANITAGTSPNAFTLIGTPNQGNGLERFIQTTAASIGPTAGDANTNDHWGGIMVAFKVAGAAARPPTLMMTGMGD